VPALQRMKAFQPYICAEPSSPLLYFALPVSRILLKLSLAYHYTVYNIFCDINTEQYQPVP